MPIPQVKKGKWSKERERTKSGRWRKKRSDADRHRPIEKKRSLLKYKLTIVVLIILVLVVLCLLFPHLFGWLEI